ncbi:MAG: glycosyltransferase family 39 protein [Anaerolineales bacterium]
MSRSQRILVIGAIGLGILAVLLALVSTKFGAGIGTDGVVYVAAARNFLAGDGISWVGPDADVRPLAIFAPLLPFVLAIGSYISGQDAWQVARWLNAILLGINILVVVSLVYWYSHRTWLALLSVVIFIFSRSMILMHTNVHSEPLFLVFLMASVFLLAAYLESEKRRWLWISGVMMGLAFLARYAGLYFIAGGVLSLLVLKSGALRDRLKPIAVWGGINAAFVVGWFTRNRLVAGSGTARQWAPAFPPAKLLHTMADDISFWFLPELGPLWIRTGAVILALILIALLWIWVRKGRIAHSGSVRFSRGLKPVLMLALVIGVYVTGLMVTRSLVIPRIDIISRTLVPAHVLTLVVILLAVGDIIDGLSDEQNKLMSRVFQIALIGFALSYVLRGTELVIDLQKDGQEYARQRWQDSPLMNAMNLLPPDTPIYTNHVEAVYLYTGRHPYRLPYGCLPQDVLLEEYAQADCQDPDYLHWVEIMRHKLQDEHAVVVLFGRTYEQVYDPLIPELIEGLEPLSVQGDGIMYVQDVDQWPENPHW